jgi:hypothetical protein
MKTIFFSMKEKVLRVSLELFGERPRTIVCGIKSGCSLILLPSFQLNVVRLLRV